MTMIDWRSSNVQLCPECEKPVGGYYPGAKVYHMSCLEAKFKVLREKWRRESEERRLKFREAYKVLSGQS